MAAKSTASDAGYHHRHARRSLARARAIAQHIEPGAHVLDVGCNVGITSRFLLEQGTAARVSGIELEAATVDAALRDDARFRLYEANVVDVALDETADVTIYGAVHHHVVNYHGLGAAVAALKKLVRHTRQTLFFETGHLGEGGRWDWQRTLRQYFSSDEEHLHYLLSCIEQDIAAFETIGRFWIHGVRRAYLRIDLLPPEARSRPVEQAAPLDVSLTTERRGRSFGSASQAFVDTGDVRFADSPTQFADATTADGAPLFLKQHVHRPLAGQREHAIGQQLDLAGAIRPLGMLDDGTLAFPRIEGARSLDEVAQSSRAERSAVAEQVGALFAAAAKTRLQLAPGVLQPLHEASLLQVCDLHGRNLLVTGAGREAVVHLVDFEFHAPHTYWRNRWHLGRILWRLRVRRPQAFAACLAGLAGQLAGCIAAQAQPFDQRIRDRRPGILSLLITTVRSFSGRLLGAVLRRVGLS